MKLTENGRKFSDVLESYLKQGEHVKRMNEHYGQNFNEQAYLKENKRRLELMANELNTFFEKTRIIA